MARFFAETATVRWVDGSPQGRFDGVEITAPRADGEPSSVRIDAVSAEGAWPGGPIELRGVRWEAVGTPGGTIGRLSRTVPLDGADASELASGWDCGGCGLEDLLQALPQIP